MRWFLGVVVLLCACHHVFPNNSQDAAAQDHAVDVVGKDQRVDRRAVDAKPVDLSRGDVKPKDVVQLDKPVTMVDQHVKDAIQIDKPVVLKVDQHISADAKKPDVTIIPPPCTSGITASSPWTNKTMALCLGTADLSQVAAKGLCNTAKGWNMCTATQYRARGGATQGIPQLPTYWIAGCVSTGAQISLDDVVCDMWSTSSTGYTIGWECSSPFAVCITRTGYTKYAVKAHDTCRRLAQNLPTAAAYWFVLYPDVAVSTGKGAVCCL